MLSFDKAEIKDKDIVQRFIKDNCRQLAKEFYFNPRVEEKAVVEHLTKEAIGKLQNGIPLYITKDSTLKAIGIMTDAKWDSAILNKRIGKLTVYGLLTEEEATSFVRGSCLKAKEMEIDAVFGRVDLDSPSLLHVAALPKVVLGDILLTLGVDLNGKDYTRSVQEVSSAGKLGISFEEGTPADSEKLVEISKFAYRHSHYHNDPSISLARAEAVYEEWIRNSLRGYADTVVTARLGKETLGYISFRASALGKDVFGTIDLIAVDEKHRGKGIGRRLIIEGTKMSRNRIDMLLVRTQISNLPAMRLYCRLGFKPIRSEVTFHVWNERRK